MTFFNDADAVASVIAQLAAITHPSVTFLLVDDGSTDGTGEALEEHAPGHKNLSVIRNPQRVGVAVSRNRAMAKATGEFLWFADSDDRWSPGILDELAAAVGPGVDLVVAGAAVETADGVRSRTIDEVQGPWTLTGSEAMAAVLTGAISGYLWNKLLRRSLTREFPDQRSLSDLPFVAGVVSRSTSVARIPGLVYTYIERPGSITRARPVDLEDLARSTLGVIEVARDAPAELVTTFRYWFAVVPVHTQWARRREQRRNEVGGLDMRVRWRDIRVVLRHDRRTGLKALLILCAGPAFPALYRALTGRRDAGGAR